MRTPLSLSVSATAWSELSKYNASMFRDANHAFEQLRQTLEQRGSLDVAEARVVIGRFAVTYSVDSTAGLLCIIGVAAT